MSVSCLLCVPKISCFFRPLVEPLPEVQSPNFLEIQNPWGKILETNGLRFEKITLIKGVKLPRNFCLLFFRANFALLSRIFLVSVLLSASVERFFVSHMRDFSLIFSNIQHFVNCQTSAKHLKFYECFGFFYLQPEIL